MRRSHTQRTMFWNVSKTDAVIPKHNGKRVPESWSSCCPGLLRVHVVERHVHKTVSIFDHMSNLEPLYAPLLKHICSCPNSEIRMRYLSVPDAEKTGHGGLDTARTGRSRERAWPQTANWNAPVSRLARSIMNTTAWKPTDPPEQVIIMNSVSEHVTATLASLQIADSFSIARPEPTPTDYRLNPDVAMPHGWRPTWRI